MELAADNDTAGLRLDRRGALKTMALGAAGVGGLLAGLAQTLPAQAAAGRPIGATATPGFAFPAPTAGLTYQMIAGWDFHPIGNATPFADYNGVGIVPAGSNPNFYHAIDAPHGATIKEVGFAVTNPGGATLLLKILSLQPFYGQTVYNYVNYTTLAGSATYVPVPLTSPIQVDTSFSQLMVGATLSTTGPSALLGARVGWADAKPPLNAIAPVRVYDSRGGDGPLAGGNTRTISVANSTGGSYDVVPPGASAIAYNLTITDTTGAGGYLALFPYGTTWAGNSTINWSGPNQTVANGGVVQLGGNRQLYVLCGGATTDFIVDLTGYYR